LRLQSSFYHEEIFFVPAFLFPCREFNRLMSYLLTRRIHEVNPTDFIDPLMRVRTISPKKIHRIYFVQGFEIACSQHSCKKSESSGQKRFLRGKKKTAHAVGFRQETIGTKTGNPESGTYNCSPNHHEVVSLLKILMAGWN
jgi:hypothetical protein